MKTGWLCHNWRVRRCLCTFLDHVRHLFTASGLMRRTSLRLRQLLIIILGLAILIVLLKVNSRTPHYPVPYYSDQNRRVPLTITVKVLGSMDLQDAEKSQRTYANSSSTGSCNIPVLDINGTEVINFFHKPNPLICKSEKNWAYVDNDGKLALIPERKDAVCSGVVFIRKNDEQLQKGKGVTLKEGDSLPGDFVSVSCRHSGKTWNGLMMSVIPSENRINKLKEISQPSDWSGLNVFILGLDSLSQMSFRRSLPRTVEYLEKEMGAVVLNGYNIVGDGTPQAFIPILTAGTEEELPLTRKRFKAANYVDDVYPFIWKNFSDAGYVTAYGEDVAKIGTFTYRLKGFRNQPTDHYTRTFFQEAEKILKDIKCLGSEPLHKSWFRYSREFMRAYADIPRFLLMHHSYLSHDDINLVSVLDDDLTAILRTLNEEGFFDNSLVIVMADHGHRFAQLRNTHQGQLEERLPFMSFTLPKSFRESEKGRQAYLNLKSNAAVLSTPFDIHATLMDILHWSSDFTAVQDASHRSLSLFRPIPPSRSCSQAGVEPHWCTCLDWQDAMKEKKDKQISMEIAQALVDTMNGQTENERQLCAPLELKELISVTKLVPNSLVMSYKNVKDKDGFVPDLSGTTKPAFAHYQVKLSTIPGRAVYEATVLFHYKDNRVDIDLTSISHVNKFGDDPHCIIDKNYFIATYCVCYDRINASD